MAEPVEHRSVPAIGRYELWMVAHAAIGFLAVGGMMFLIPPYVLDQGGTPADVGSVMALAGALALSGPFIGNAADRYRVHRGAQLLSLGLTGAAAVSFAFAEQELLWLVAATLLGLGMAGLAVVNATFVVGRGFDSHLQARKLSLLQLSLPAGQVLGLASVAALSAAGVSFRGRFLILAAASLLFLAVVAAVNANAARQIAVTSPTSTQTQPTATLRTVLISQFGLALLLITLIMTSGQAIESQYPNYMQQVFNIDNGESAGALSVAVLVSIPLYLAAGRWTAASGPVAPFLVSAGARTAAGGALLLLPTDAGTLALIVFGVVVLVYPLFELDAATLAATTSPIGPGGGQGAVGAALAAGTILASVTAGWVADRIGFSSLATIVMITAATALVLGLVFLRPTTPPPAN